MATQQASVPAKRASRGKKVVAPTVLAAPKMQAPTEEHVVSEEQRKGEKAQAKKNATAQFTQTTMQTPAVHEPTAEQQKMLDFQKAVEALANSMGVQAPSFAQPAKSARATLPKQNGITRPASGSTTGIIWDVADEISAAQEGNPAAIAQLRADPRIKQINENTLKTQYARWRAYHGIKGRVEAAPVLPHRRADDPQ